MEFDRDEWEMGADVLILDAVYGRLSYSTYEMDGDWVYDDGTIEPQEYTYDAYTIGVGFRQDYPLDYLAQVFFDEPHDIPASNFGMDVDAFEACLASDEFRTAYAEETEYALSVGLTATPSFLVNDQLVSASELVPTVEALLAN